MKKGYLGIDIGSISTKAVLLDEDDNIIYGPKEVPLTQYKTF